MAKLLPTDSKSHRTAVVIDVRFGVTKQFRDRYERLLDTFASPYSIQVDIYTLGSNKDKTGPGLVFGPPASFYPPDQPGQVINLGTWAKDTGYDMYIYVAPTQMKGK